MKVGEDVRIGVVVGVGVGVGPMEFQLPGHFVPRNILDSTRTSHSADLCDSVTTCVVSGGSRCANSDERRNPEPSGDQPSGIIRSITIDRWRY